MDERALPDCVELQQYFAGRVPASLVRERLAAEAGHGKPVAGRSTLFAYLENWLLGPNLLRAILRAVGLLARGQRNALAIRVVRNELPSPRLPAALDGLEILHLSDLHIDSSPGFEQALQRTLGGIRFDLCVITGDLRFATGGCAQPTLAAMARLRPVLGERAILVLGNHDSLCWVPALETAGYEVLVNETTSLQRGSGRLWIVGLDDVGYFATADLASAARSLPAKGVSLVLSHSPEIIHDPLLPDFDYVLCGHTHGGQVNLPGGWPLVTNARCPRKFCRGPWVLHHTEGYTSLGAGTSLLDVRFNCPPEVTLHKLRRGQHRN